MFTQQLVTISDIRTLYKLTLIIESGCQSLYASGSQEPNLI